MYVCMYGFDESLFLDRLRPSEQLTSNQLVSQLFISFAQRHKQPTYFSGPKYVGQNMFINAH